MADIDSNLGEIKTNPLLPASTAAQSLDISQNLGIQTDPVSSFKPSNSLETDIDGSATALRSVANESDQAASIIKPDAKKLSTLEKYNESIQIQFKTASLGDKKDQLVLKQIDLRKKGQELSEDELFALDGTELQINDLEQQRAGFDLNTAEKVLTGDLPSVFRDMAVGAADNPVVASLGALGFLAGPVVGANTLALSTSAASGVYNYNRTLAKTYRDLENYKDGSGNKLPEDLKLGISRVSAGTQASLEFASDVILKKMSKLWNGPKIAEKIAQKAFENPTFRNKLADLATRSSTAAITEGVTEVLQDMAGDFAESTGATWSKQTGINITESANKFGQDFDTGKYAETFGRSFLTGGLAVGTQDAAFTTGKAGFNLGKGAFNKGKQAYQKLTGKKIELGPNNTVVESDVPSTEVNDVAPPTNPYIIKDGVPTYLTPAEAITLGHILPSIESIRNYNIGENAIATEVLQQREAEKNGVNQVFIDKEKLNEWADTTEKKQAIAKFFIGDKGVQLDAQKVPLTREEYYALHKFGNTEFLTDSTAITSTGMTVGDLKELVKSKNPKTLPKATDIPASGEQNTAGEIDLSVSGVAPVDTTGLDTLSSDAEISKTLNNKQQADAYLKRLQDEQDNILNDRTAVPDNTVSSLDAERTGKEIESVEAKIKELENTAEADLLIVAETTNAGSTDFYKKISNDIDKVKNAKSIDDLNSLESVTVTVAGKADNDFTLMKQKKQVIKLLEKELEVEYKAIYNSVIKTYEKLKDELQFQNFKKKIQEFKVNDNGESRFIRIEQMKESVNRVRESLPEFIPPPDVDPTIADFEKFGDVTENVFSQMTPNEQAKYQEEITKAKTDMKRNFKEEIISEYDKVMSLQERELNAISEDETVNAIMSDDNIVIVDSFMADKSLRIDPTTLTDQQRNKYGDSFLINDRKVFKKRGMHIEEVAAQLGVTSDALLEALDNSPTSQQAFTARTKFEEARNKKIAADSTEINKTAIDNTIENTISLKKKMLNNILRANPAAGLRLIHSIFKVGNKTAIENVKINAQETTDNTRIGDLKPSSYLNASRKHMNRANTAMNKDQDLGRAAANVEKSLVADELFKASTVTVRKLNRILDTVSNLSRNKAAMEKLKASGHYEGFQALLAMMGQRKLSTKDLSAFKDLMITWQDKGLEQDTNIPANISGALEKAMVDNVNVDINNMSFAQVETIKSVIDQLLADSKNEIAQRIQQQKTLDLDYGTKAGVDVTNNPYKDGSKSQTFAKGGAGWWKNSLGKLSGLYSTVQSNDEMLDWFKLDKESLIATAWRQVKGIGLFDNGMGEKGKFELTNKVKDYLYSSIGKDNLKRLEGYAGKYASVPEFDGSTGLLTTDGKIRYTDMLGMLLIYGQKDGRNRLSKYGINVERLPEILRRYLDPRDIEIVKAIWKSHDFLKPGIENVEKTLRGVNKVEFVEGESFMWGDEKVDGGYIHLSYKTEQSVEAEARRDQKEIEKAIGEDKAFNDNDAARGFTKEGFKKTREKNVEAFVNLDLNLMVDRSLGAIVANNTMLVPIYNAMRILNNPAVAKQYINVMGKEGYKVFKGNILTTGRNSNFDIHQTASAFAWVSRALEASGANFMASKIVGSFSSVMNQFLTFPLIVGVQIDKRPSVIGKSAFYWLKMLTNPRSVKTLIDQMSDHVPAIKTDKTSYQVDNVQSFKMFDKSESSSRIVRAVVDSSDKLTEIWLSKIMGGLDTFNKTSYALALMDSKLKDFTKSNKTEAEVMREVYAFVDEELSKVFPDRRLSSAAYIQTHPVGRAMVPFFNDARRAMNAFYFPRMRDMIEAITKFQKNSDKNGIVSAVGKSSKDLIFGAMLIQVHAAFMDASMSALRGEDDEGDKSTSKDFFTRFFRIFKKDFLDPWMAVKGTADVMPVVSSVKFYFDSDGRGGGITTPTIAYLTSVVKTAKNLYDVKFKDDDWNNAKSRDLVNAISGVTPFPASPLTNYVFGESRAFQTGVKGIFGLGVAVQNAPEKFKDVANVLANTVDAQEMTQFEQSKIDELYNTLLNEPGGRTTLANYIEQNKIPIMSGDDLINLIFTESGGDPLAKPKLSSATGIGQFISRTWNNLKAQHPRDLAEIDQAYKEETEIPDGAIDGRTDPRQSMIMLERLHKDISKTLVKSGIRPDLTSIYIGHHFGAAQAVEVVKASGSTSFKDAYIKAFDSYETGLKNWEDTKAANPWVKESMTISKFMDKIDTLLIVGLGKQMKWEEENGTFDPMNLP